MSKSQKIFLFIDGSNLYGGQYELFGPSKYLNFSLFIKEIEQLLRINFNKIYFYASFSPKPKNLDKKQKRYLKNEALFYRSVRKTKDVVFFKGYRSPTSGKEKEVDVKLAVDIVDFAHRKTFDKAFLLSGDADFMQALHTVKKLHIPTAVFSMQNKVMFKALLFYKTYVIRFHNQKINFRKIRKHPEYITLDKNKVVKNV